MASHLMRASVQQLGPKLVQAARRESPYVAANLALGIGGLATAAAINYECNREAPLMDAELEVKEAQGVPGLVMSVDFNNFLPCLTVQKASEVTESGLGRIQYKPAF